MTRAGLSSHLLVAISLLGPTPLTAKESHQPIVARAALLDSCPGSPSAATEMSVVAEMLFARAADVLVDHVASLIDAAAKADREPTSFTTSSPDLLYYKTSENKWVPKGCVIVVVGEQFSQGGACLKRDGSDWTPEQPGIELINGAPWFMYLTGSNFCASNSVVGSLFRTWGIRQPKFYSEIRLQQLENGPADYLVPEVMRVYYPRALRDASQKGSLIIGVTVKDARRGADLEELMSASFLIGTPRTPDRPPQSAEGNPLRGYAVGQWLGFPKLSEQDSLGSRWALPVQLEVALAESHRPNLLLQELAKIVAEKKTESAALLKDTVVPSRRAAALDKERADALDARVAAVRACASLAESSEALVAAKAPSVGGDGYKSSESREAAIELANLMVVKAKEAADKAWVASAYTGSTCQGIGR